MMRRSLARTVAVLMLVMAATAIAHAAQPAKPGKTDPAQQAMLAEMAKLAAPTARHSALRVMEGTWKTVTKAWYGPGEPTVSEGTSENRLVMGGRYLEQRMKGTLMGQPFEGYGLTGYDNRKNEYVVMWADNASTWITHGAGQMDDAGKQLVMKASDLGQDGKPVEYRMVTRLLDANKHVFSMTAISGAQEQVVMEITYTRK